jgi:hypothetical protein
MYDLSKTPLCLRGHTRVTLYYHPSKESFYPYGISVCQLMHEQFEDTTEVTRSRASKDRQYKRKRRKGQNKGNNKIAELRTIFQKECQNS